MKEALIRKYQNANLSVQAHATYLRLRCLKQIWDCEEVLGSLKELQASEVQVNSLHRKSSAAFQVGPAARH